MNSTSLARITLQLRVTGGSMNSWEESWSLGSDGPVLTLGQDLSRSIHYRLDKAVRAAAVLWDEQLSAISGTRPEVDYSPPAEPLGSHRYYSALPDELPVDMWAVDRGTVHGGLVAMRNELFRDILERASGWSGNKLKKKVDQRDWPQCFTPEDWDETRRNLPFVPDVLLDRIEVTQPFRDQMLGNPSPPEDWMRQGGVQSSRRAANDDKHEGAPQVAVNIVNATGIANYSFDKQEITIRDHRSSPGDGEPLMSVRTDVDRNDPITIESVTARVVVPNRSLQTREEQPWTPANRDLWHQVIENVWVLHTVQVGVDLSRALTWNTVDRFQSFWDLGDAVYEFSKNKWAVPGGFANPFQQLYDELGDYQEDIRSRRQE